MKPIYRLEQVDYCGFDSYEEENIETSIVLGYFSSFDKVSIAVKICNEAGIDVNNIRISTFFDDFSCNQRYVYVLSHEYYIINQDGTYLDYSYIFRPFSNRQKCVSLKSKLSKNDKYAFFNDRYYNVQPPDGFRITKMQIDFIYPPIQMKI
jgi:hypothetical protein